MSAIQGTKTDLKLLNDCLTEVLETLGIKNFSSNYGAHPSFYLRDIEILTFYTDAILLDTANKQALSKV